jgi:nucleoid-associated protein YejK
MSIYWVYIKYILMRNTLREGLSDLRIDVARVIIKNKSCIYLVYIKRRGVRSIYVYYRSIYILDKGFGPQKQPRYYI